MTIDDSFRSILLGQSGPKTAMCPKCHEPLVCAVEFRGASSGHTTAEASLMGENRTDCRSEEGITVGLVDSIITGCRVLVGRDLGHPAVIEALRDLRADSQVRAVIGESDE